MQPTSVGFVWGGVCAGGGGWWLGVDACCRCERTHLRDPMSLMRCPVAICSRLRSVLYGGMYVLVVVARRCHLRRMQGVPRPTAAVFRQLDDAAVRAMSVIHVRTLADLRSDKMGGVASCGTCGRSSIACDGHFGHIELPVAVQHPLFSDYMMRVLPVPPTRVRLPNAEHDAPLTSLLRRVLAAVCRYGRAAESSAAALKSAEQGVRIAERSYYVNTSTDSAPGLSQRLRGKAGILRQNLMGWRVNSCARAVIAPDPYLAPWEVGVPGPIASVLGLRNGDSVIMNRQPSLHRGSLMGHIVVVRPHEFCFTISPTVTPPYNADFDGDEMNLHATTPESAADARYLIGVEHTILSVRNGAPSVRLVQDACLAQYLMRDTTAAQHSAKIVDMCEASGQPSAARHLHELQLESHAYMQQRGFSVGVDDFLETIPVSGRDVYTLGTAAATVHDHISSTNRISQIVRAGSKGSAMNLVQLFGCVGQQTVQGQSAQAPRTAPGASSFVSSSFTEGLAEHEFWMHACAAREGMIQTAIKTADSGYLMRRMVKCFENVSIAYDDTVRTSTGHVIQFCYGGDGIDTATSRYTRPRVVEPGTAVGIICAQSIGEKLTQLTLDTFHRAGVAFKHGLGRVRSLLDASQSASSGLLRGVQHPDRQLRYALSRYVPVWTAIDCVPSAVHLEVQMRGMVSQQLEWRAEVREGLLPWQVAVRVREQCVCVSDSRFIYAAEVPDIDRVSGPLWAGPCVVDSSVPIVKTPPLARDWYSSEPVQVARQLGIEAAGVSIQNELRPYMTGVDDRHLCLLSDAMTYTGHLLGATRQGLQRADIRSVLGHACFETGPRVLATAASQGVTDPLHSASSRMALGIIPRLGGHTCDILHGRTHAKQDRMESLLTVPPAKRGRFDNYM